MGIFSEKVVRETKEVLNELRDPVTLTLFTRDTGCEHCPQASSFTEELVGLDDRLRCEKRDLERDGDLAKELGIDQVPALALSREGGRNGAVVYYGIPGGYEFGAFLRVLVLFSTAAMAERVDVSPLKRLTGEVNIKVFVLTSCPSCPVMAYLCAALAFLKDGIRTEVIEANTFPDLASRFSVATVPKTVINDAKEITGVLSPSELMERILEA